MTLWRFLMLIPVLNVPYEATIIALFSCSVISLTFSRPLLPHRGTEKTCLSSTLPVFIKSKSGCPVHNP